MKTKKIEFLSPYVGYGLKEPYPSLKNIPEAYKKLQKMFEVKGKKEKTIKACIPFLDSLTCGYIIPFPVDIKVRYNKEGLFFEGPDEFPQEFIEDFTITNHPNYQVPPNLRDDKRTFDAMFKFRNIWTIKTPKNTSCLFTQPFNRNAPFKIIDGIVDTDSYLLRVNFPFYWTGEIDKEYTLCAGDPMALVFPFERDNWKMDIKKEKEDSKSVLWLRKHFLDNYKRTFWKKKSYK